MTKGINKKYSCFGQLDSIDLKIIVCFSQTEKYELKEGTILFIYLINLILYTVLRIDLQENYG